MLVTGAAGQIAYSILPAIASGYMLGADQPVILHLLDIPPAKEKLKGVVMELQDCYFPLVKGVVATVDIAEAFDMVEIAILVGAFPRKKGKCFLGGGRGRGVWSVKVYFSILLSYSLLFYFSLISFALLLFSSQIKGMERAELLSKNANIFSQQGQALRQHASRDVKVCVVGNPANTNCLLALLSASGLPEKNFTAMTRLDQNRAMGLVSEKLGLKGAQVIFSSFFISLFLFKMNLIKSFQIHSFFFVLISFQQDVRNVIIWGNHSANQYPDVTHAVITNYPEPVLSFSLSSHFPSLC